MTEPKHIRDIIAEIYGDMGAMKKEANTPLTKMSNKELALRGETSIKMLDSLGWDSWRRASIGADNENPQSIMLELIRRVKNAR